jgi:site-specific DNA recombinase
MKTVIGYIRVSSEQQADSGLGLAAQRERIAAYCQAKGWQLGEVYEDAGVSAAKPLSTRPAGSRLLADLKKGKAVIIIAKLDRAFRSVADATNTIAGLDKRGVAIVSLAEGFDTTDSNPFARAMLQMVSIFAELERNLIRQRTKDALSVKRSRGERISRHAPYGWDFGTDGRLVENPGEQQGIAFARQLRQTQGCTLRQIAEELDTAGVKAKHGGQWSAMSVRSILARGV